MASDRGFSRHAQLGLVATALVMAIVLSVMGRGLWCDCASAVPWSFDVWSRHNSQHLLDPYTLSHVLHGVVFFWVGQAVFKDRYKPQRWVVAGVIEAAWEIAENTNTVIERYRESTVSLDYYGDSVLNSVSDLAACMVGYGLAAGASFSVSVVAFVLTELVMVLWIRDSLILNVIMLLWPMDAIRDWQSGAR